jgi:hypothetical protein
VSAEEPAADDTVVGDCDGVGLGPLPADHRPVKAEVAGSSPVRTASITPGQRPSAKDLAGFVSWSGHVAGHKKC